VTVVDTDVGRLILHSGDQVMTPLIQRDHSWEAPEGRFLRSAIKPGATVVDVGANVGYMTLLARQAAGPDGLVVAVEPEPANVALLKANLWLNRADDVRVLEIAAWSRRELLPLWFNPDNRGDHRVGVDATEDAPLVQALPLDDVLEDLVLDVVKIDTQGADHEALAGMSEALARSPDVAVLTEFWLDGLEQRSVAPEEVLRAYREQGFHIALLADDGSSHEASDQEALDACEASGVRFLNLVLRHGG
jgi:FkbM family methyltransferase